MDRPRPKFIDCRLCGTDDLLDQVLPIEEAIEILGYYEDEDGYVCRDCQTHLEKLREEGHKHERN